MVFLSQINQKNHLPYQTNTLLVISGPTAVGKTALAISIARFFQTEIISADSRQFFQEMTIGTAKPSPDELAMVPHHFIDSHQITDQYDVKRFEADVLALLAKLFLKHKVVILTGGSGLYIDAVCKGFDPMPSIPKTLRETIIQDYQTFGLSWLQQEVLKLDPVYFSQVDQKNPQRLMRALEVCKTTNQPYSSFRTSKPAVRDFRILKIALERPREQLYARIDQRMDDMLKQGLVEEARGLYPLRYLNALQTVGYSEIFDYMDGLQDYDETIRLLKRNSRRYAKRQLTWLKKDPDYYWFHPGQESVILEFVENQLKA